MALNEEEVKDWCDTLEAVCKLSLRTALHIGTCPACQVNRAGVRGICGTGDSIWDELDKAERHLIKVVIPAMRAHGMDVTEPQVGLQALRRKAGLDGEN